MKTKFLPYLRNFFLPVTLLLVLVFISGAGWGQSPVTFISNDTYLVPQGVTSVIVQAWGGGGSGGGCPAKNGNKGGGGAGGSYTYEIVSVSPGEIATITVGNGGVGGNGNGGSGGTTSFVISPNINIIAIGGAGGLSTASQNTAAAGAGLTTGTTHSGGAGGTGVAATSSGGGGGGAGSGGDGASASGSTAGNGGAGTISGGNGAAGRTTVGNGNPATALSGGGSGAFNGGGVNSAIRTGGNGFRGQLIITPITTKTWTGTTSPEWKVATNWNPQVVPDASNSVIIPVGETFYPIISATTAADCFDLTIAAGASLTINSDGTNSGSLIFLSTSSGNVTYNRWMYHAGTDYSRWYITSAPVNATGFNNATNADKIHVDATPNLYDFATYSESGNDWLYEYSAAAADNLPGPLTPGKGYLISLKPTSDGVIQFTGTLNDEVDPISITRTEPTTYKGWNGLGNPYTSAIKVAGVDPNSFLEVNKDELDTDYAAIYVWNETAAYGENSQYYRIIGNAGYTYELTGIELLPGVVNIQAGQGFLVKSKEALGSIVFNKDMQRHESGLSLKSAKVSWPGITLLAESKGQTSSPVVAYNEQMTTGLDVTYDAGLLSSSYFNVYTHLVGGDNPVDFAIQCLPDNQFRELSVPVGVDLPEGGELSFKASGVILPQGLYPVIEDKLLGTKTALKTETDSYSVVLDKNTSGTGRFYLSVAGIGVGTTEIPAEKKFKASFINNRMVIWGAVEPGTKAQLYDITGRKVGEYPLENLNRNEIMVSGLSRRVYLLKIEGKNYSQVIKVAGE